MYRYVKMDENDFIEMLEFYESRLECHKSFSKQAKILMYDYIVGLKNSYKMSFTEKTIRQIYSLFGEYKNVNDFHDSQDYDSDESIEEIENMFHGFIKIPNSDGFIIVCDEFDFGYIKN